MTEWIPDGRASHRIWILEDVTELEQPELEVSGSGRRVRQRGRQDTSEYERDRELVIQQAVNERTANNPVLFAINKKRLAKAKEPPPLPEAALTFTDEGKIESITCTWRFRHESLPLVAEVDASIRSTYLGYDVEATLMFDEISTWATKVPRTGGITHGDWDLSVLGQEAHDALTQSETPKHFLKRRCRSEREAISQLRDHIEVFQDWDEVAIPDTRNQRVEWFTLDFSDTNVEGELLSTIADYLDSAPLAQEVLGKYNELRVLMRQLGVVIEDRKLDDFQRAATTDGEKALMVKVQALAPDGEVDGAHAIYLHLMTGTISVSCSKNIPNPKEASEAWQLARFEAEMKGELDSFLAHYDGLVENRDRNQIIDVINERRG